MDAVVNPPRPGEASYESWDAEVQGVLASLKESVLQIFKLKIVPEREREDIELQITLVLESFITTLFYSLAIKTLGSFFVFELN